ncbi:MAG TPA: hypothetical protein VIL32_00680 [Steroidobacteraceae bacterium]
MGHINALRGTMLLIGPFLMTVATPAQTPSDPHNYPTSARVEYVQECIRRNGARYGNELQYLYKCSCAIDAIARELTYDEFVEASTFARYSSLPGEGGAIFRDSDEAKAKAKLFRDLEDKAYGECGFGHAPPR